MADYMFTHSGVKVRVSEEVWTDENGLNGDKHKASRLAERKIAAGEIKNGEVLITSADLRGTGTLEFQN